MIEWNRMSLQARADYHAAKPQIPIKTKTSAYNLIPKEQHLIDKLADEMVEWTFANKTLVNLDKFPLSKRLSPYRFYRLAQTNPYFAEALEVCRYLISDYIQTGWASKELDNSFCKEMLPKYDQDYREWIVSKVTAAIEARTSHKDASNLTVVLEAIPTTSIVPERTYDDETRDASTPKQV